MQANDELIDEYIQQVGALRYRPRPKIEDVPSGIIIAALSPTDKASLALDALTLFGELHRTMRSYPRLIRCQLLVRQIFAMKPEFDDASLVRVAECCKAQRIDGSVVGVLTAVVGTFEQAGRRRAIPPDATAALRDLMTNIVTYVESSGSSSHFAKIVYRIDMLPELKAGREKAPVKVALDLTDAWAAAAWTFLDALPRDKSVAWADLIAAGQRSSDAKPNAKWLKLAGQHLDVIGRDTARERLMEWFDLVGRPAVSDENETKDDDDDGKLDTFASINADALRGFAWATTLLSPTPALCRSLAKLVQTSLIKIPGVGPRCPKLANAAVFALGQIDSESALGQLAILNTRVTFRTTLQQIDKALQATATRRNVSRDDIEEIGVPDYGFDASGTCSSVFPEGTVTLAIDAQDVRTSYFSSANKPLKSAPAALKDAHKPKLRELAGTAKDVQKMIVAQRERIDSLFLLQKSWPMKIWRERYLMHPLVGTIARRLIWTVRDGLIERDVVWSGGSLVDVRDEIVSPKEDATILLWHPIERPVQEVLAWREWLFRHEVRQPFKQAHREIYCLTDAERRTATYSNRFAAHVLRQHQFNALCASRRWKNKLRLLVDDEYPPARRDLPQWGLRAEFWIEGIGDDHGTDTTQSGSYLRVATDQLRFHRTGAASAYAHASGGGYRQAAAGPGTDGFNDALPLDQIPPLVLSEIMRDVDLFVGVASIGNDPNWEDSAQGNDRYAAYWGRYAFGDLSETAKTRHGVLESLLPRITRLAGKWTLTDKFLVIRGSVRTYKIHLGSGNILMEPNDQYLCIVPSRSTEPRSNDVFLPFEGDPTLSIIVSKAFLLANDDQITDVTITRQIEGK